jgi:hypothetical protein
MCVAWAEIFKGERKRRTSAETGARDAKCEGEEGECAGWESTRRCGLGGFFIFLIFFLEA